ncbi:MAG: sodium:solute symporter [Runella slithyformis]|nr:MAG: sodium:solute symporter [Runella slithyformis]TAE97009.1 MAG: sodium:solute symporter [Runella slithyformis]TAF46216.1 MAG: sodium:solute symporter [Runella slithyformis]TAF80848.1 MAG: sodium:solute symporter [Runella slithyformis]TAH09764.1 MAG: sodium:solute symporter [Runella slithyformis]
MLHSLSTVDMAVVVLLLIFIVAASMWSSFKKKDAEEYFMASRSLRWWSVAGSIFGTNIHAQQIIGMMGVGYSIGFAQSHYEVWAIPAILVVAYVFIPIYRKRNFFTLSQFLEKRYNANARLVYTILMITFIMIQLVGGFYIGSRTLGLLFDGSSFELTYLQGIFLIASVTVLFTVFGGMESVVVADNILTVIMIISVLLIGTLTYMQPEIGGISGLLKLDHAQANKMHLYLPTDHPKLPWLGIFTGLTILNMFYWTTNQYQVQRVLAAQTDRDAKLGSIAAGFLKLVIPFFSIAAGSAAFYLFKARLGEGVVKPDDTFLTLLKTVVPVGYGFVGLILAGLLCAIFSAIYSMMNSVSTMMAFDVYKKYINPHASDKMTVRFGQMFVVLMCVIAIFLANSTYDPTSTDNFFLVLANQTSYIKPGLVVAFFWGVLWKKTNAKAAVIALIAAPFIGLACDWLYAEILVNVDWIRGIFGEKLNFLYRVFMIFVLGSGVIYGLSRYFNAQGGRPQNDTDDLTVSFSGIGQTLWPFLVVHALLIGLCLLQILSPQAAAYAAALFTLLLFGRLIHKHETEFPFYQSDIFYAGILTTAMVWIMYFFA